MLVPITLALGIVATSFVAAVTALLMLSAFPPSTARKRTAQLVPSHLEQAIFLFDDRELLDATGPAKTLLKTIPGTGSPWNRITNYLSERISGFEAEIALLQERGEITLTGKAGRDIQLHAELVGDMVRLTITDLQAEGQAVLIDTLSQRSQEEEITALRETIEAAPIVAWRQDNEGTITWANSAYLNCASDQTDIDPDDLTWPIPAIFPSRPAGTGADVRRQVLHRSANGPARWYECHRLPARSGSLHFAIPADAVVKAETSLRDFVQTLTKTFAHLPIGLAIFDRQRQLALFNPALVDLTSVGADFLSARPTLFSFLDRLRETQVIPEPKDYRSWRAAMSELEKAAASDLYQETWTLTSGQTYRVTGRPHPDGAVAFLFEDISAEISLARHFRSEIELGQSVVDTLNEAIAVFSPAGELILSNARYDQLWGVEPSVTLGTVTILDSIRVWQTATNATPIWGDIRDFVGSFGERVEWSSDVILHTGETLSCRIAPLPGGTTLIGFERLTDASNPAAQRDGCSSVSQSQVRA
ncbi:PAS-domain containing protein [Defluviimonas aestuarii]|uniref:PAS-domain containing protein n=1 Tax=Albidovulum aestuarii TaxID=1130726 RepID=UPI00249B2062|nr:PAS-domain containing protein [Defluviimonas aestuarii]MDI3337846.1 PAS-domain containing protein [Defluviimonas aestuarii]